MNDFGQKALADALFDEGMKIVEAEFAKVPAPNGTGEWQPIATAPRDGRVIELTWMDDGQPQEVWPMQWAHIQRNDLFAPSVVGMWVVPDGSITWTEHDPAGGPTHWRERFA